MLKSCSTTDSIYEIKDNPTYETEIRALQDSDRAQASTVFNPLLAKMINNTHAVKKEVEAVESELENYATKENVKNFEVSLSEKASKEELKEYATKDSLKDAEVKTAEALKNSRTIGISGAVIGTPTSFNGSTDINIPITALNVGAATTGTLPITRGGTGATSAAAALTALGAASDNHTHSIYAMKDDVSGLTKTVTDIVENKVDKETGKSLSTEDYTTAEKNKLKGIAEEANNYIHPSSHAASMITEDATHRFTTDTEKTLWNNKVDSNGDVSDTKIKSLDSITGDFPFPAAGESTKTVIGKVRKFFQDFNDFKTGVITVGRLVNNGQTTEAGYALDARYGKTLADQITQLNSDLVDTGWIAPAELLNGFNFYNNPPYFRYRKYGKIVEIQGVISPPVSQDIVSTTTTTTNLFFKLPAGYRPNTSNTTVTTAQGSGRNRWALAITPAGNMHAYRYGDSYNAPTIAGTEWLPFHVVFLIDEV